MNIGCFALVHPFQPLGAQLAQIAAWGFKFADVTDNSDGASLGVEFGFAAVASLDANPHDIRRLFAAHGLEISSWCAHANLLDPAAPWRFGTAQIIKAIRAAALIGVKHVITTEGEPSTPFGHALSEDERIFSIREKLNEPLRLAEDLGVKLLIEPHGPVSGSIALTERVIDACNSPALGLNLDTGNLWLGGGDPVAYVRKFGSKIEHVHWKDMPAEMEPRRGQIFGCGMATIALGDGVVGIAAVVEELKRAGFNGHTTLEVAGEAAVLQSRDFLIRHNLPSGDSLNNVQP
jgi:inosose dehydratase